MKVEELSIGDWVNVLNYHWDGTPLHAQINGIIKKHGTYYLQFGSALSAEIDRCEPIPITPEILEKNGFAYDYDIDEVADGDEVTDSGHYITMKGYTYTEDNLLLDYCNGVFKVIDDFKGELYMDAEYVHQVQQALRLLGIDKEITL